MYYEMILNKKYFDSDIFKNVTDYSLLNQIINYIQSKNQNNTYIIFSKCGEYGIFSPGFQVNDYGGLIEISLQPHYKINELDSDIKDLIKMFLQIYCAQNEYQNVIIGTSSYDQIKGNGTYKIGKNYIEQYTPLSISHDGGISKNFHGKFDNTLAPSLELHQYYLNNPDHLTQETLIDYYIKEYYQQRLRNTTGKELLHMLQNKYGEKLILLDYEDYHEFCVRRLLANFIELSTHAEFCDLDFGIVIPELVTYREHLYSSSQIIGYQKEDTPLNNKIKPIYKVEKKKQYQYYQTPISVNLFDSIPNYKPQLKKLMKLK